jgi:single-strand DNA-binding protein
MSLIGRLTRDPEFITTDGGTDIATLRLAVDRRRRNDGAAFLGVKCFERQARACADHLATGRQVAISGRLELDQWKAEDGTQRSRLYVIAQSVEFLGGKPAANEEPAATSAQDADDKSDS